MPEIKRNPFCAFWRYGIKGTTVVEYGVHETVRATLTCSVVQRTHRIGSRYSGLSFHHQDVFQTNVLPLGTVVMGLM